MKQEFMRQTNLHTNLLKWLNIKHRRALYLLALVVTSGLGFIMAIPAQAFPTISEYQIPTSFEQPYNITSGPDGNLWFTRGYGEVRGSIGKVTPAGKITMYQIPTHVSRPNGITSGPDGNVWFAEGSNNIGKITPSGAFTEYAIPTPDSLPWGITNGPDGNAWFTEISGNKIGKITPDGAITEYHIPTTDNTGPGRITTGSDGNLWFTLERGNNFGGNKIGKITPLGDTTFYEMPTPNSVPASITEGPDGNVWFTEFKKNKIGKITPAGVITEYPINGDKALGITAGPDGNVWFTEGNNKVAKISLDGKITEYPLAVANSMPNSITSGPDGNVWFTEIGSRKIGRVNIATTITAAPAQTNVTGVVAKNGIPVGNATVTVICNGNEQKDETDAGGNYSVVLPASRQGNILGCSVNSSVRVAAKKGNSNGSAGGAVSGFTPKVNLATVSISMVDEVIPKIPEYPIPMTSSYKFTITNKPDGNLWPTKVNWGVDKIKVLKSYNKSSIM